MLMSSTQALPHREALMVLMNLLKHLSPLLFLFQISSTNRVSLVLRTSRLLSSVLASGLDAMPLRLESIEEHQRGGSGEVFPDTGDGGKRLAEFIEEKLK